VAHGAASDWKRQPEPATASIPSSITPVSSAAQIRLALLLSPVYRTPSYQLNIGLHAQSARSGRLTAVRGVRCTVRNDRGDQFSSDR
jgi:hypothetical protein